MTLWVENRDHWVYVAHLVAAAFIGECPPGQLVRHLDDDTSDEHVSNLAYGTRVDNSADAVRNGRLAQTARTQCPAEHLLIEPNLVASRLPHRICLSCARARSRVQHNSTLDLREVADAIYAELMPTDLVA